MFQCISFMHRLEDVRNKTFNRGEALGSQNLPHYQLATMQPPPHISLHNSHESEEELENLSPQQALNDPTSTAVGNVKPKILLDSYSIDEEEEICPTCLDGIL